MERKRTWRSVSDMLINNNPDLLFVGVYDTERFEPVSLAGSSGVRNECRSDDGSLHDEWNISLSPGQARALTSHIRYGRLSMVRVDIAHLQFACLRHGTSALTGMSNFNMEPKTLRKTDKLLFSITNEHYTRQDSFEDVHALNIAAILQDEVLIVGVAMASDISVIKLLKELILIKDYQSVEHIEEIVVSGDMLTQSDNPHDRIMRIKSSTAESMGDAGTNGANTPMSGISRIEMRMSTKSDAEKKNEKIKRQTSFCEDWRTATIRSIEALQKIGPFNDSQTDNDTKPLLDNIELPAVLDISQEPDHVPAQSTPTTQTPETRRKSRVTLV